MCFSEENLVMNNSPFFLTRGLAASPLLPLRLSSRPLPLANRQPAREEIIIHPSVMWIDSLIRLYLMLIVVIPLFPFSCIRSPLD